jgi:hypothetical protein
MQGMATGRDLTPPIQDASLDVLEYVQGFIQRFAEGVTRIVTNIRQLHSERRRAEKRVALIEGNHPR